MKLHPLDHYFPDPELRSLHSQHFKCDKVNSNEMERNLLATIDDYKKADKITRLNPENYYRMFKLMLQIEDENDSKKMLKHDQCHVKIRVEPKSLYSMTLVSITSAHESVAFDVISDFLWPNDTGRYEVSGHGKRVSADMDHADVTPDRSAAETRRVQVS